MNKTVFSILLIAFGALLLFSLSGCKITPDTTELILIENVKFQKIESTRMDVHWAHKRMMKNYTHKLDPEGEDVWDLFDGNYPFQGDCEDFAFAMQKLVGAGSVYLVANYSDPKVIEALKSREITINHAVFIYAGIAWELDGTQYSIEMYEKYVGKIWFRLGDVTPELR